MSIPLDRLYHYIESVAQNVYGDTVIYRFWPHGSKKIEDLAPIKNYTQVNYMTDPQIFCNDQEPLNFKLYQNFLHFRAPEDTINQDTLSHLKLNLRKNPFHILDSCVLLHSEKNSPEIKKYSDHGFVPAYYWSHAVIARDWYRYAQYIDLDCADKKAMFLIYNRAWSNTREYRLKFAELLAQANLIDQCHTSLGFYDQGVHYSEHKFQNPAWKPNIDLSEHFKENTTTPCYSADFDLEDYQSTQCEVVLETLFDTTQLHLTEKTLRPIALGHPFLLCAVAGSLQYLRDYGFKTFDSVIDESYDNIINPQKRLNAVVDVMKTMSQWDQDTKHKNFIELQNIANYNKKHFFSNEFFDQVDTELRSNLSTAIYQLIESNTYSRCIALNQCINNDPNYLAWQTAYIDNDIVDCNKHAYKTALNLKKLHNK